MSAFQQSLAGFRGFAADLGQIQVGQLAVGDELLACDIHWACFSAMLDPMPQDVNPMPGWLRPAYAWLPDELLPHRHAILLEHRDHVFAHHLGLPLDY